MHDDQPRSVAAAFRTFIAPPPCLAATACRTPQVGLAALHDRATKRLGERRKDLGQQVHDGIRRQPAPDPEARWLATWRRRRNRSGVDAIAAQQLLDARKMAARVGSLPSSIVFDRQDRAYREAVLRRGVPRIGVEAGVTRWWGQYGCSATPGIDRFGESAPAAQLQAYFEMIAEKLARMVELPCEEEHRFVRSNC